MPKKVSKKKTTRRSKKVSRKKSKNVTKRKPKYKRRKRRFGSSLPENLPQYLKVNFSNENPMSNVTNASIRKLATGEEHKKSFDYRDVLDRIKGIKGIQALYHKIGSGGLKKIGKDKDEDINKRHRAFHTVLVAIISAILQLTDRVGRTNYTTRNQINFLGEFSSKKIYESSAIKQYSELPKEQTEITEFEIIESNGVVTGFTHKFRNKAVIVSMAGRQDRNILLIETIFEELESRLPTMRDESKIPRGLLNISSGYLTAYKTAFNTVVNLNTGELVSTQDPQNNDQVVELATSLGTMSVNRDNTIVTSTGIVNETLETFKKPSEKELTEGLKQLSEETDPFANFFSDTPVIQVIKDNNGEDGFDLLGNYDETDGLQKPMSFTNLPPPPQSSSLPPGPPPEKDGKPFSVPKDQDGDDKDFGDVDFGRRKRKKKVSKKKGPSAALKKLCKRLKVKLTTKRGGKRVYKSEKVLKSQCKKAAKKSSFGKPKKKVSKKKVPSAALKKLCKRLKVKLTTKRGGKRVYKSEKVLKELCKKAAKKTSKPKKKVVRRKRTSK
tara:strand:+ start:693 stop:2354 length:1662 start_codon:yes stop_codon:yes gene_type:complete